MGDTVSYHTSPVEVADPAREAGINALVLSHLTQAGLPFFTVPGLHPPHGRRRPAGLAPGQGRMTVELPVGSTDIKWGQNEAD